MNELKPFGRAQRDSIKQYVRDAIESLNNIYATKSIVTKDFKMDGLSVFIDGVKVDNVKRISFRERNKMIIDRLMLRDDSIHSGDFLIIDNDIAVERLMVTVEKSNA